MTDRGSNPVLDQYVDILIGRGLDRGLLGPREKDRVWSRHIDNSLALNAVIGAGARVVDVGSGAGLPGIPLAIMRPDLQIILVEPLLRRATFLSEVVDELRLTNRVSVIRDRAENLNDQFDVVTARAVAPLDKLLMWTSPLFLPAGQLMALKGSSAPTEVAAAKRRLDALKCRAEILSVRADATSEPTSVVRVFRL